MPNTFPQQLLPDATWDLLAWVLDSAGAGTGTGDGADGAGADGADDGASGKGGTLDTALDNMMFDSFAAMVASNVTATDERIDARAWPETPCITCNHSIAILRLRREPKHRCATFTSESRTTQAEKFAVNKAVISDLYHAHSCTGYPAREWLQAHGLSGRKGNKRVLIEACGADADFVHVTFKPTGECASRCICHKEISNGGDGTIGTAGEGGAESGDNTEDDAGGGDNRAKRRRPAPDEARGGPHSVQEIQRDVFYLVTLFLGALCWIGVQAFRSA